MSYPIRTALLGIIAVVGYLLPWFSGPGASLSMGAYDLAEWLSIHPLNRDASPSLLWSLLLRVPLTLLVVGYALTAADFDLRHWSWWLAAFGIFGLGLYSLPPLEFLADIHTDYNTFQQAVLCIMAILAGCISLTWRGNQRGRYWLILLIFLAGLVAAWLGLTQAIDLASNLWLAPAPGIGFILFTLALTALVVNAYYTKLR